MSNLTFHTLQFYLFTVGSTILITLSILAMVVHHYLDGYSIKHDRLSYSGKRRDFIHPIRKTEYKKNSYPQIFNLSLTIPGILYLIAFTMVEVATIKTVGIIFSSLVILIGAVDVSTYYHLHNGAVIISQPVFMVLVLVILLNEFDIFSLFVLIAIFLLVLVNIYQKQRQNRDPSLVINVIPQKLFIYLEAIYFIILPIHIL